VIEKSAYFRFYEELNDFLPRYKRKREFEYNFTGNPSVKDAVEAIGVPHPEIDLIIVNNESVGFDYQLHANDMISVYPVFESIKLRAAPLRRTRFILDVNLGKLTRLLRLCGFDSSYNSNLDDHSLVKLAGADRRIILTRDRQLLKRKEVSHGYWIRNTDPYAQLKEVVKRLDLKSDIKLFSRCLVCNAKIKSIPKQQVINNIPPKTRNYFDKFYQCTGCLKVYWQGSHYKRMQDRLMCILDDI
jgi:uncharacterized protein with PIN domain